MTVDLVVPVYNEAHVLAASIRMLVEFLSKTCQDDWRITIADNGSTDQTPEVMRNIVRRDARLRALRVDAKGRGLALKRVWGASEAAIHAYMDVDLSTGLDALPPLLDRIRDGYDIATGSRHIPGTIVTRGRKRDLLSRGYNRLLRMMFHTALTDTQCGFKAVSQRTVRELLPRVGSDGWFFDTELLLLAEHSGYRIAEVPVRWVEDRDSRVRIVPTMAEYLREVWRLRQAGWGSGPAPYRPRVPGGGRE